MIRLGLKARLAAAGAVALALAACNDRGGRVDAPEPASLADLSAMSELPYAEPARVDYRPPAQGYAWAERAYGLQRAVYDTPPDYGFDYDGVEPLVWETDDDWAMYAEPWDEGYRYYYYEPGAYYPYFVRDDRYGYGFGDGGVLIAVFDLGGRYLPSETVYGMAPVAGRYYARGHALRTASVKAPRIRVADEVWAQRAPQVIRTADPWLRAARDDRAWRAWRERDQDRELRRFEPEAKRRADRTREWRERDDRRETAAIQGEDPRRRQQIEVQRQVDRQDFEAERHQRVFNQRQEQAERQQRVFNQRQEQAERQRQAVSQRREQAERQQLRHVQIEQAQQQRADRAEEQRRQQVERRQQAEQRDRAQRAQQQRQQAEQQQERALWAQDQRRQQAEQQRERAQQAQQQRREAQQHQQEARQQEARRQEQQAPRQQQARSAQQQGQPAAARERGGDHRQGRGPHDRKD